MIRAQRAVPPAAEDLSPEEDLFRQDVLRGLGATPKTLPSKYFYDEEGSRIFDRICELEEYYPTRTELAILEDNAPEIVSLIGEGAVLVEPGAGSSLKVRRLLDAAGRSLSAFVPLDISGEHLVAASEKLAEDYPQLKIIPIVADFSQSLDLDQLVPAGRRVGFFPGSTIGNFTPKQARGFLRGLRDMLGENGGLIIGVDLQKDRRILEAAYDDSDNVTAAFNLNLLSRINRELGGDFDIVRFAHRAIYNDAENRIEMHLVSLTDQSVTVDGVQIDFADGETIHTENSYKYTVEGFAALAESAGWRPVKVWTDQAGLFSVHYLAGA